MTDEFRVYILNYQTTLNIKMKSSIQKFSKIPVGNFRVGRFSGIPDREFPVHLGRLGMITESVTFRIIANGLSTMQQYGKLEI